MGRREIEATTRRMIHTCDLCGRDLGGCTLERCAICGREVGYCCSALRLCYDRDGPGQIDLTLRVCRDCEQAGQDVSGVTYLELIRDRVATCDHAVVRLRQQWREWAAEWRAKREG